MVDINFDDEFNEESLNMTYVSGDQFDALCNSHDLDIGLLNEDFHIYLKDPEYRIYRIYT